ncbi:MULTISPECIES: hypothetical protein [Anaerococcus]|uniref:LPXTG-motif cell wall anchor domain protein n=1 Tax=Anaerococcus prevotii ACS-065-V-Col13 TaxID=879305 RepID=F0GV23_9FIRM|nr:MULTISPECIES: hypothetical protein [Anaerococcus]EGC82491.1 hypothetical protein HMPREF9290_1599 [Anaerococcus prevotii ACS-065-V-Col13]
MNIKKIILALTIVLAGFFGSNISFASGETIIEDNFIVKEVNEEGVTLEKKGYEGDLYRVDKKEFKQDPKVGEEYIIKHNDIILPSNPAQFNKIYEIKKVEAGNKPSNKIYFGIGLLLVILFAYFRMRK